MTDTPSKKEIWQQTQRKVRTLFAQLKEDANGDVIVPDDVKTAMAALNDKSWDSNRRVYTFGTGNTQQNVLAARAGLVPWWSVLTGAAFFGALDDLRYIKTEADKHAKPGQQPDMTSALTWITFSNELIDGVRNKIEPDVIKQLLEWGADPNHDNGKWFATVMRNQGTDVINLYLDHGGSLDTVSKTMLENKSNTALQGKIAATLVGRTFDTRVGEAMLVQTQIMPDTDGTAVLRTVFNFRSQRVHEIYEGPRTAAVMQVTDFEQYNSAALGDAYDTLKKLGGSAPDILRATGKPLAVPSGLKRKTAGDMQP